MIVCSRYDFDMKTKKRRAKTYKRTPYAKIAKFILPECDKNELDNFRRTLKNWDASSAKSWRKILFNKFYALYIEQLN